MLNTSVSVAQAYSGAGYRRPLPDGNLGGTSATDIYVDTLPAGLYGYCTTDQPKLTGPGRYDVWAYCVVDNDYAGFPANTPLENLQVTVAHEYFHATQFAYDAADDGWAMEATAAWVEDEVYDDVDDNVQYLADSPITDTKRSMDKFGGLYHYGVWIWFRYLTEKFRAEKGGLPKIVLDFWKAADSSKGAKKDRYFTQAMAQVLRKRPYNTSRRSTTTRARPTATRPRGSRARRSSTRGRRRRSPPSSTTSPRPPTGSARRAMPASSRSPSPEPRRSRAPARS